MKHFKKNLLAVVLCLSMMILAALPATSLQVNAAVKTPATVKKVTEATATTSTITLSWKSAKNATGYEVWASKKEDSGFKKSATISDPSITACVLTKASGKKLKANKTYYVKVRAVNKSGSKKKYGKYSSTVAMYTTPKQVSSLKVSKYTDEDMTLTWKAAKGATGYELRLLSMSAESVFDESILYDAEDLEDIEDVEDVLENLYDDIVTTEDTTYKFKDLNEGETYIVFVLPYKEVEISKKTVKLYGPENYTAVTMKLST
nr:fibronectin type III domain-containing protein [Lachnospiraceae bacterium]